VLKLEARRALKQNFTFQKSILLGVLAALKTKFLKKKLSEISCHFNCNSSENSNTNIIYHQKLKKLLLGFKSLKNRKGNVVFDEPPLATFCYLKVINHNFIDYFLSQKRP
jgi:hypothetical protein